MSEHILTEKPVIEADAMEPAGDHDGGTAARRNDPGRGGSHGLALLLLIAVATAGGGYYLWQQLQAARHAAAADHQALTQQLASLEHRVAGLDDLQQRLSAQGNDVAGLQSRQQSLETTLSKLRSELAGSARFWDAEQIAVLLQVANDRLRLEGEVGPSLAALEAADRHLQQLHHPGLLDVRRRLADEINALKSVPKPDIPGMALNLEAVINGIDRLPVGQGQVLNTAAPPAAKETGWRGVLHDLWEDIKSLVVIKRRGQADRPLLAPDERYFLRQNLRLELESARLALLRHDRQSYQDSLRQAREWISQYFDDQAPATAAALEQLTRLQQTDIAPPLPDISASLNALQDWLTKQRSPAATTAPEAPSS